MKTKLYICYVCGWEAYFSFKILRSPPKPEHSLGILISPLEILSWMIDVLCRPQLHLLRAV